MPQANQLNSNGRKPNGTVRSSDGFEAMNAAFSDGARLKTRLDKLRMGQRELSDKSGYCLGTVNAALNGTGGDEARPDIEKATRYAIAELLDFFAQVMRGVA